MKALYFLFLICISTTLFAQNNAKIEKILSDYYKMDRENIHLHLNKNTYLSNETIWFKGYVIEKKESKLNFETTNVYVRLLDNDMKELNSQLVYATNGTILGHQILNKNMTSGNYFLHVYTNYMNNFEEDESTLIPIQILNINEKITENSDYNVSNYTIDIAYEGGKLISNIDNTIGIRITNCKGEGVKMATIEVVNSNNQILNTFATNDEGYGKFILNNTQNEIYTIRVNEEGKLLEKKLDLPETTGITLSINNYANDTKTAVSIKTNSETLKNSSNNSYSILIQKNNQANIIDFKLDSTTKDFYIEKNNLFEGINIIRLLNQNLESVSERIIYYNSDANKIEISTEKKRDSLLIKGKLINKIGNLSISVLPVSTNNNSKNNSIIENIGIKNYLNIENFNANYYFKEFNKKKNYELDLVLIHNKSNKYLWNSILNNPPIEKHTFDVGVTIEGKINQTITNKAKSKLKLYSSSGISEYLEINDKNEFAFNNVLAIDSSYFYFSLMKNDEKYQELNIYSTITNNKKRFQKNIQPKNFTCNLFSISPSESNFEFPKTYEVVELDAIDIEEIKKQKLENNGNYYNSVFTRGYKIRDEDYSTFRDVLSFIQSHGYDVFREGTGVIITSRMARSFNGTASPAIILDNMPISDFSTLTNMSLQDIDEIYINKHGFGMGNDGINGSIRIYTKKEYAQKANTNIKSKALIVKNGFLEVKDYKNPNYQEYTSNSFKNHGTIDWIPNIYTNENGEFEFTIPTLKQDKIQLNIQGIDNYGNLYEKSLEVNINE